MKDYTAAMIKVFFETDDGGMLMCMFYEHITPGFYSGRPEDCYPAETEKGEANYSLDGIPHTLQTLPQKLISIAEEMYEHPERYDYQHATVSTAQEDYWLD